MQSQKAFYWGHLVQLHQKYVENEAKLCRYLLVYSILMINNLVFQKQLLQVIGPMSWGEVKASQWTAQNNVFRPTGVLWLGSRFSSLKPQIFRLFCCCCCCRCKREWAPFQFSLLFEDLGGVKNGMVLTSLVIGLWLYLQTSHYVWILMD